MYRLVVATEELLPDVARLESEIFGVERSAESLGVFCSNGGICVACLDGDRLVGYCTVLFVLDEAQIIDLATHAEHRRCGVARKIMELVLCECTKREASTLSLEVRRSNSAAINLYSSLGFEIVGERRGFYSSPREDALVMIKNTVNGVV